MNYIKASDSVVFLFYCPDLHKKVFSGYRVVADGLFSACCDFKDYLKKFGLDVDFILSQTQIFLIFPSNNVFTFLTFYKFINFEYFNGLD